MPRSKPVEFMGKIFKTQGEFEKYVKNIIYDEVGICNDIKNLYPDNYNILIELLKRNPKFKSKSQNMCNLKIQQNKLSRQKAYEILIINNDETTTDISWKHDAIKGESKTKDIQLKEAMRSSVDEQILDFRRKNEIKSCEICGNIENLDVDHNDEKNSAFAELVSNFSNENENIELPENFGQLNDETNRTCFLEKDNVFRDKWNEYHRQNAKLRMLCSKCNLSRPKTKKTLNKSWRFKCSNV
jgi:hypothetical protein